MTYRYLIGAMGSTQVGTNDRAVAELLLLCFPQTGRVLRWPR